MVCYHHIDLYCFADTSFYIAAPLSLCSCCAPEVFKFAANQLKEFIVKGKNQMPAIEFDWWGYINSLMKLGWSSWLGAAIFSWGWIHQHHCHAILVSLFLMILSVYDLSPQIGCVSFQVHFCFHLLPGGARGRKCYPSWGLV